MTDTPAPIVPGPASLFATMARQAPQEYTIKLPCPARKRERQFTLYREGGVTETFRCPVCGLLKSFAV